MIAYYPNVIVALMSIYLPHSTAQSSFIHDSNVISENLQLEKPGFLGSIAKAIFRSIDLVCNELTLDEKKRLCDEAMRAAVAREPEMTADPNCRNIRIDSFLRRRSTLAVPPLADPSDPYTCKKIPIERFGYEKNMFWCPNRVFMVVGSGATDQAQGFFIADSSKEITQMFIFKQSQTNDRKVVPWAMMRSVRLLFNASVRFISHVMSSSSSSSTVTPLDE